MSILDVFRKRPGESANGTQGIRRTWSEAPRNETVRLPQLFHQTPRLDPVELIASSIANAEIQLFDKAKLKKDSDNAEPLSDHPFYDLMENPSKMFPEMDGHSVKYITVVLCELLGEAFWLKIRAGRKVTDILPFPPAWCISTPTVGSGTFLFQPFGTTAGSTIEVDPEDVVWFKQPNVADPYGRGRGRTEATGDELDTDEMVAKWQKNYFYNDATPPFWANIPGASSQDLDRIKETWGQKLGGWLNARKPAFSNSENLSIVKLSDTMREMDFVASRRYLRDVFLQHYAIPPEMFGIIESSNRSTIDAAYYLFAKNVIKRRLGFYERAINRQLISRDYDARLEARIEFDVPEDENFKLSVVNEGLARGALTRADWKRAMGYKVDPGDDVYIMSYSMIEVPRGKTIADVAPDTATVEVADEPTLDIADDADKPIKAAKVIDERKIAHWKTFDNRAKEGEGMFRARIRAFAEAQESRLRRALTNPYEYKAAIETAFIGADKALKHALAPAWEVSLTDGAHIARSMLGLKVSPSFELYNKSFQVWIQTNGLKKAKEINETTYTWLLKYLEEELTEAIEAGESIQTMTERLLESVAGVYENMNAARAEMIARTETMSSVNFGQRVVYADEGVKKKEWLATPDSDTRDDHAMADGQTVGMDEMFKVGDESLDYPGDPNGSAGNVINCRCTILPVIER